MESNLNVDFEPFIKPHTKDTIFTDDLDNYSFVNDIIESSFDKTKEILTEILTLVDKDTSSPFDSSKDASNVSVESSPFDSSKHSYHLRSSHQEVIASTKG